MHLLYSVVYKYTMHQFSPFSTAHHSFYILYYYHYLYTEREKFIFFCNIHIIKLCRNEDGLHGFGFSIEFIFMLIALDESVCVRIHVCANLTPLMFLGFKLPITHTRCMYGDIGLTVIDEIFAWIFASVGHSEPALFYLNFFSGIGLSGLGPELCRRK